MGQDTLRIATYNTDLARDGPGLLLRDLAGGRDPQVEAVAWVIGKVAPDIILLQGVDYDYGLAALTALRDRIGLQGPHYQHLFALAPNRGMATGIDLDGDGRLGTPDDAQGFAEFAGQDGMAILSRYPIDTRDVRDFSAFLWKDLPEALLPETGGGPFPSAQARAVQRLSTTGHWVVPVTVSTHKMHLLAFHATPPVFDGPEDRNGRRNHDEVLFWRHFLDGAFGPAPVSNFVLLGDANLDPKDSDGRKSAISSLLDDPRLTDPEPRRPGPVMQAADHTGDPGLDTVAWPGPDPGQLRVSYILPSTDLEVRDSGVYWPAEGTRDLEIAQTASRHRVVWVDLSLN